MLLFNRKNKRNFQKTNLVKDMVVDEKYDLETLEIYKLLRSIKTVDAHAPD